MKVLSIAFAMTIIVSGALICSADTYIQGEVYGTWTQAQSPFYVVGNLSVTSGNTLTIEPGVVVEFLGNYSIEVDGLVMAQGTEEDSIIFTGSEQWLPWNGISYINNPEMSVFQYCLFEDVDRYPDGYGGAFYVFDSPIQVEHCTFRDNRANRGAAMYVYLNYVSFRYNVCYDNQVAHHGGAINFGVDEESIVERCVFYNNDADGNTGGAIYFYNNDCPVNHCTFVGNSAAAVLSYGSTSSEFKNCIFWDNPVGSAASIVYSDVQGGWPGTGNIDADPMFVDPANEDYHLMLGSPCIDAGDPNSPLDPDGTIADMGAYFFDQIGFEPGELTVYFDAVDPPVIIPSEGGSFDYTADILCSESGYAFFDAWTELVLPDGQTMSPIALRQGRFINAGDSMHYDFELYVSTWAQPGIYEYWAKLGEYPDSVYASDFFEFEKLPADGIVPQQAEAYATISGGWLTEEETFPLPAMKAVLPKTMLINCAPNPFNPETNLEFSLPVSGMASLTVYDLSGRTVTTLLDREMQAGWHEVSFDGSHLASGIYFAVLKAGEISSTQRLLLLK
ncbi:right-handed parallel beta-helix repeat-containing protein [bacterium]|nr:right-handed parallel beta-helix repeat-containing protein [bacterium]MBU1652760.1 right-handed parallel beta-helix repeat-containing protein [bacterium]MBU1880951.1 right-handed parallel beta-helix repeat-containing protein [bacterium]